MDTAELMRRVRLMELATSRRVTDVFAGEYSSAFRGQGIEFSEVREYEPGDDIRSIDWNVTARAGRPFVKRFKEERELTVVILADVSGSGRFGSGEREKSSVVIEAAALIMFAALRSNDRVGLLAHTDRVEEYVAPRKGRRHALRLVRDLIAFEPEGRGTDPAPAVEMLSTSLRRSAMVFWVSDFMGFEAREPLRRLSSKHDVIAARVTDPAETRLPRAGLVELTDPESGARRLTDLSSARARRRLEAVSRERTERLTREARSAGVDLLELSTRDDVADALIGLFLRRERRR